MPMASVGLPYKFVSDLVYFIVLVWRKQLKWARGVRGMGHKESALSLRPSDTSWVLVAPQALLSLS